MLKKNQKIKFSQKKYSIAKRKARDVGLDSEDIDALKNRILSFSNYADNFGYSDCLFIYDDENGFFYPQEWFESVNLQIEFDF